MGDVSKFSKGLNGETYFHGVGGMEPIHSQGVEEILIRALKWGRDPCIAGWGAEGIFRRAVVTWKEFFSRAAGA